MQKKRLFTVLLSSSLVLSLACNFIGQLFNSQGAPSRPETAATNSAQILADGVTQAATNNERVKALLQIMKALNLGVYTGEGEAILLGAERGPSDFYLYDFEVSAIAGALERKETWSVADLAAQLSEIGVQPGGKPLIPRDLQESLTSSASESIQNPEEPLALVHLLIRELGLRQAPSYDIAAARSTQQIEFDALQRFLILSDVLVPLGHAPGQSHNLEKPVALMSNQDMRLRAAGDPCSFVGTSEVSGFKFGKLLVGLTALQKKAGPWFIIAGIVLDAWHAELLGILMDVQETQASKSQGHHAHYGPKGEHTALTGTPGEPILFQIGVQMVADLSKYPALKCGKLAGLTFPPKGPVKDVAIRWDNFLSNTALLEQHGTIVRKDELTDSNGIASLVFQPKDEPDATQPVRLSKDHIEQFKAVLGPSANVATSFGNVVAFASNVILPDTVAMLYSIEYHALTAWKVDGPFGETHIAGEICSLKVPFTLNWDSSVGLAGTITFSPSNENGGTWSLEGALASGGVTNAGTGSYTVLYKVLPLNENAPYALVVEGTASQTTVGFGTITRPFSATIQLYPNECSQP